MQKYIHEIQLTGKDEFAEKFNYVSWLWEQSNKPYSSVLKNFYWEEHKIQKYNLEQGMPISFLNEYSETKNKYNHL